MQTERKVISWGLMGEEMGSYCLMDTEFQSERLKKFWRQMAVA